MGTLRRILIPRVVAGLLLSGSPLGLQATAAPCEVAKTPSPDSGITAETQLARSAAWCEIAASARADASRLREALAKEKASIAINIKAPENSWWRKARLHYEPLIAEAEARAAEAERRAEYHRLRALEMSGR